MREALKEEEQLLIITRLHQVRAGCNDVELNLKAVHVGQHAWGRSQQPSLGAFVQVIRPFMLRRTKLEVEKELPSKTAVVIKCGQSAWQSIIYSQISDQVINQSPVIIDIT